MTNAEIIAEIKKLPLADWTAIKETVDHSESNNEPQPKMTEDEFAQYLFAKGVISNIPDPSKYTDEDFDFEPIEVRGEPLSEMIIRERR